MIAPLASVPARVSSSRAPASSPAADPRVAGACPSTADDALNVPLDVEADSLPDTAPLTESPQRRLLLAAAKQGDLDQETQLRLDRMRAEFDNAQAERSELMRESNVLRDMAMEQQKRDDEILKKWIALI